MFGKPSSQRAINLIVASTGPRRLTVRREVATYEYSATQTFAFVSFLLATCFVFLRPPDLIFEYEKQWGYPIFKYLIVLTSLFSATAALKIFAPAALLQRPINVCVCGVFFFAVFSHLTHSYVGGMTYAISSFSVTFIYFVLLLATVDTFRRFRIFLAFAALSTTAVVAVSILDFLDVIELLQVNHVFQWDHAADRTGKVNKVWRLCGPGIFNDPNDLCQVIMLGSVMSGCFLTRKQSGPIRVLWVLPFLILLPALFMTKSRGGLLGCGVAFLTYLGVRFGGRVSVAAMLICGAAVPLIAGRQGSIDVSSGTGHSRLLLWRDGLEAIKGPQILFGIGHEMYAEYAGLVAHNSYWHTFVELGLFGGTMFLGCFLFAGLGLYRMGRVRQSELPDDFWHFRPFVAAMLAGWCTGMLSLSRCYVVPTYLVIGAVSAFLHLGTWTLDPPRLFLRWNRGLLTQLLFASAGMFIATVLFIKVFAR